MTGLPITQEHGSSPPGTNGETADVIPIREQIEPSESGLFLALMAPVGRINFEPDELRIIANLSPQSQHITANILHHAMGQQRAVNVFGYYQDRRNEFEREARRSAPKKTLLRELAHQESYASVLTMPYRITLLTISHYQQRLRHEFSVNGSTDVDAIQALYEDTDGYNSHPVMVGLENIKQDLNKLPDHSATFAESERVLRLMLLDTLGPKAAS